MSGALGTVRELEAHEWMSFQTRTGQQVPFTTQRFQQRPLHLEQPRRGFREADEGLTQWVQEGYFYRLENNCLLLAPGLRASR